MDQEFSLTCVVEGDHVTVTVAGEVDMANVDVLIDAATPRTASAATVDLRSVTFFDSAAIHALIRLAERYRDAFVVLPSPRVLRMLQIAGLAEQPWLTRRSGGAGA